MGWFYHCAPINHSVKITKNSWSYLFQSYKRKTYKTMLDSGTNTTFSFYYIIKYKNALLSKIYFLHTKDCIWCTHFYTAISKAVPCREHNMITISHSDSKDTAVPESWLSSTKKITCWAALWVSLALSYVQVKSSKWHASFLQQHWTLF